MTGTLPESDSGSEFSGGERDIPMDWLSSQFIAERMMYVSGLGLPDTMEFRAGRDVLALTVFFSGPPQELLDMFSESRRARWAALTAHDEAWRSWVIDRLGRRIARHLETGRLDADVLPVKAALRWLLGTELLPPCAAQGHLRQPGKLWTPAWQVGLSLCHLAIHA